MKIIFALFSVLLFTLPVVSRAQTIVPEKIQKGDKTLVSVPVTVSDREGRYITGLKKEDFSIYQDGIKQDIELFATEDEPLNVALLLDTSGSTKEVLDKIKDAAKSFVDLLNPSDRCLIATFDSQIKILSSFSSDQAALKNSLDKAQTAEQDGTIIHRAIEQTARQSFAAIQGRKVIVILSDGKDFGSSLTKGELLNVLEESDVLIYSIFYQTGTSPNKLTVDATSGAVRETTAKQEKASSKPKEKKPKKQKGYTILITVPGDVYSEKDVKLTEQAAETEAVESLKEIAEATAGRFYLSDTPNLREVFKKIAGELRRQYRLGFYSKDAADDATVHDIVVKVGRTDVVVRARGKFRAKQL